MWMLSLIKFADRSITFARNKEMTAAKDVIQQGKKDNFITSNLLMWLNLLQEQ